MLKNSLKIVSVLMICLSMAGCFYSEAETTKHDAKAVETVVNAEMELKKMEREDKQAEKRQSLMEKDASAAAQAEMRISDNEAAVELKKTMDVTAIEQKKLEMQDKTILDVNRSEERKMEYEMKKLELEMELRKMELEKARADSQAKANELANKKAQAQKAAAQARQKEVDIYKAILND